MNAEIHAIVRAQILEAAEFYAKDLRALPEVELTHDRGVRLPIDFTYETVNTNRRLAARLRGTEPATAGGSAPELFRSKDVAIDEILGSAGELIQAWDELGPEGMTKPIPASGEGETALSLAIFAARHIQYHDGQLTSLQQTTGDDSNHWAD